MNYLSRWIGGLVGGGVMAVVAQPVLAEPSFEPVIFPIARQGEAIQSDFARHFQDLGIEGSIAIYDLKQNRSYQHNPDRNATRFLPASTFKILNSLISLETEVITNDLALLTWDGVERTVPAWNRDLNVREAFRLSAVWFYQVLARRIGHERMQQWVTKVGYGNQDIGSPDEIAHFWLDGALRITPEEQIQFLQRLHGGDLPFSDGVITTVKDIMLVEQTPDYALRAKTGWASFGEADQAQIGWYVGYLEQSDNVYFFATNIDIRDDSDAAARATITRRCLGTLGLL